MLLPRILAPVRASAQPSSLAITPTRILDAIRTANGASATSSPSLSFVRHATHQAQGRANGAKDGPGKRLGAKKAGGEYVIPGNIIFRQRGTTWFPGENCKFGRDHCIFAMETGYVRYYRDPLKHPDRQYIGVALNKEDTLPYPRNAPRKRRLNMVAVPADPVPEVDPNTATRPIMTKRKRVPTLRTKYAYGRSNWEIGRAAERANVKVTEFVPGDRWTAWKKRTERRKRGEEMRKLRNAGKKAPKPKARKPRVIKA
ncbi:hypothetical protein DM02DRAFT_669124 [Periconia macrospinosa]|uniref:Large ribosomal subunit protein bL27m n=1 Tax=Periconia macrospinosa TaxID=97972 RepID=A0A2V1E161_9PLEO|nr:hypothetical protein DM02DRAFT_669124 [Periconia macrospinosa]